MEREKVEDFKKGINSLRITNNYSIFITGSNSRMILLELSIDLSGRYVSFRINPFSFKEDFSTDNIKQINIFDFLMDDNF